MIGNVPSWKSSDGKFHTDYVAALKHEVMLWLSVAGENEVGAKKIADKLNAESVTMLIEYLTEINKELSTPSQFHVVKLDDGKPMVATLEDGQGEDNKIPNAGSAPQDLQ